MTKTLVVFLQENGVTDEHSIHDAIDAVSDWLSQYEKLAGTGLYTTTQLVATMKQNLRTAPRGS